MHAGEGQVGGGRQEGGVGGEGRQLGGGLQVGASKRGKLGG